MAISNNSRGSQPGVCTSTTRPTAPYEGQTIYETDTDLTYTYGGSAWQQVSGGTAVGNSGLVYIKSQTIGSAVGSVNVTNVFSSTYDHYLIQISGGVASGAVELRIQIGTTVTNYFYQLIYGSWSNLALAEGTKTALNWLYAGTGTTNGLVMNCFIYSPNLATRTRMWANYFSGTSDVGTVSGMLDNTNQYTDFTVVTNTGTMTGGTITVYGYRKA